MIVGLVYSKSSKLILSELMKKIKNRLGAGLNEIFESTITISNASGKWNLT